MDEIFQKAAIHAKTLREISEDAMLKLYGLYKQALNGPCTTSKPPFWDFTGKAKWQRWKAVSDLSCNDAKEQYITLVEQLDTSWDRESMIESKQTTVAFGISVSTMANDEEELADSEKTILDWCKEGSLDKMKYLLSNDKSMFTFTDENGMGIVHWAVDRGHVDIVNYLIDCDCELNIIDVDGQTPLHYAASCDHVAIVKLLIDAGADSSIKDKNGCSVLDSTDNKEIRILLQV